VVAKVSVALELDPITMAPEDSKAPFLRIPWAASLLRQPDIVCRVPRSRIPKVSTEDSLFAEVLKTPRTVRSCISFFKKQSKEEERINEITTLMTLGNGMNGHPAIMHGGIVATILDEAMGILQEANLDQKHMADVGQGYVSGELPPVRLTTFTAELKIRYIRPVHTPGSLMVKSRYIKKEGRKEWIFAEILQRVGAGEDYDGEEVLCATGEALFIQPKDSRL
jgi:acyl-coenzyme A thioesterase PaaI-like protein